MLDSEGHLVSSTAINQEGVDAKQKDSADQIQPLQREGRSTSRVGAPSGGLLRSRKAVLPSEIRRREKSVDDPMRGHDEDLESHRIRRISEPGVQEGRSGRTLEEEGHDGRRGTHMEERAVMCRKAIDLPKDREGQGVRRMSQFEERDIEDASKNRWTGEDVGHGIKIGQTERRKQGSGIKMEERQGYWSSNQLVGVDWESDKKINDFKESEGQIDRRRSQTVQSAVRQVQGDTQMNQEMEEQESHRFPAEGQGRRRRGNLSESEDVHVRRRRISQTEDGWDGRRVRKIGQLDEWEVQEVRRIGQSDHWEGHQPEEMDTMPPQAQLTNEQHSRVGEGGGYLQRGSTLPQAQHRVQDAVDLRPKVRNRSMSDIGVTRRSDALRNLERAAGREAAMGMGAGLHPGDAGPVANGEMSSLDTRVSVAKLRHSYLETASGRRPELYVGWHVKIINWC